MSLTDHVYPDDAWRLEFIAEKVVNFHYSNKGGPYTIEWTGPQGYLRTTVGKKWDTCMDGFQDALDKAINEYDEEVKYHNMDNIETAAAFKW